MNSVDVNVLLEACFEDSPRHEAAVACLEACRRSPQGLSILSVVASAFVRTATDRRIFRPALSTNQALSFIAVLADGQTGQIVEAGRGQWGVFVDLVAEHGLTGGDVTDGWLAAAAIEARATWYSFDRGFARFRGLRWIDPVAMG